MGSTTTAGEVTPAYYDTRAAARYCGISRRTLESLRIRGGGPRYCRPRGLSRVVYAVADLDRWLRDGERTSTSDAR